MRVARYISCLAVIAVFALAGCTGQMEFADDGATDDDASTAVAVTLSQDTVLGCWIATFAVEEEGDTLPEIDQSSVEEAVTVTDADGNELGISIRWSDDASQATICAPLVWCAASDIAIAEGVIKDSASAVLENLTLPTENKTLTMGDNPGDYDGDCFADFLVGAYKENTNRGLVRLYYGDASPSDGMTYAEENGSAIDVRFGSTVAYTDELGVDTGGGPDLLIGAHTTTDPVTGGVRAGMVHLYQVTPGDSSSLTGLLALRGRLVDRKLGKRLGYLGDVNGDGVGDFAAAGLGGVGEPDESREPYLVLGSWASDISAAEADAVLKNNFDAANLNLSYKLKGGEDFNGDGIDDIFVSGISIDLGDLSTAHFRVFFYSGDSSISGNVDPTAYIWGGGTEFNTMGHSLDIGDVNGDGDADLIVGSLQTTLVALTPVDAEIDYGSVFIYLGPQSLEGELTHEDSNIQFYSDTETFGVSTAYLGDTNGDRIGDIGVTSFIAPNVPGYPDAKAYLYYGRQEWSSPLTEADAALTISGTGAVGAQDQTICNIIGIGDLNNDGLNDYAIGAVHHATDDAYVYIFLGQASYSSSTTDLSQAAFRISDGDFSAAAGTGGNFGELQYDLKDDYTPDPEPPPKPPPRDNPPQR